MQQALDLAIHSLGKMNAPEIITGLVEQDCCISFPTAPSSLSLFCPSFSSHCSSLVSVFLPLCSPLFALSLLHSSCLLFCIIFFQVELIGSFLEIPTFSKKPNKWLPKGKAQLTFQIKRVILAGGAGMAAWTAPAPFNPCINLILNDVLGVHSYRSMKERVTMPTGHENKIGCKIPVLYCTDVGRIAGFGFAVCFGHHATYILWQHEVLVTLFYLSRKRHLLKNLFSGSEL